MWLLGFLALFVCVPASAEPAAAVEQQFTWHYGIEWRLVHAGTARLTWTPDGSGFEGDLHIQSAGFVSKLYRVNDQYSANLNQELCVSSVAIHAEEGKRRRDTTISFAEGKAMYNERDLVKNSVVLAKETPVPACVYDYIGGIQVLRMRRPELGQAIHVPLSDGKKAASIRVEAQEREEVSTPLGKFETVRYQVHMFNGALIDKKARLYVWLTDDDRRLPVQIRVRMQFLIGTIDLKLEKQESTSNP
jgi:hypothetical protein